MIKFGPSMKTTFFFTCILGRNNKMRSEGELVHFILRSDTYSSIIRNRGELANNACRCLPLLLKNYKYKEMAYVYIIFFYIFTNEQYACTLLFLSAEERTIDLYTGSCIRTSITKHMDYFVNGKGEYHIGMLRHFHSLGDRAIVNYCLYMGSYGKVRPK